MKQNVEAKTPIPNAGRARRPLRLQLVDEVIQRLKSRLASGEFKVGDKIPPESVLAADFGIGRTTLREAVRVLEHSGLLAVRQGSGTYLRSLTDTGNLTTRLRQARVLEVIEVRRALDIEMARLTATRRSEAALAAMRNALERMRKSKEVLDERSFLDADMEMSRLIAAATRNTILTEIHASFSEALRLALTQVVAIPGVMVNCLSRHEQLYEAILAQDEDLAGAIAKAHLEKLTKLVENLLGDARVGEADRVLSGNDGTAARCGSSA
jgi:GntR family transcriptional regulator, transcriptional repressor for pyruvate dehydrogenase complex